jgi:hypothetical protein
MIIMIAINLLGLKKIKTANFLPALVFEILFVILVPLVLKLFALGRGATPKAATAAAVVE